MYDRIFLQLESSKDIFSRLSSFNNPSMAALSPSGLPEAEGFDESWFNFPRERGGREREREEQSQK